MGWSGQYILPYLVHEKIYKNYLNLQNTLQTENGIEVCK